MLVHEMVAKHGLELPFADLGGLRARDLTIADYTRTIKTGDQQSRYLHLKENPFEDIAPHYAILNPQYGDPPIEELALKRHGAFGTIVCLSVLEHVVNPFEVFKAFATLLRSGGLLICSTVFSFPRHDIRDNFRYSPDCLEMLSRHAGLQVLEAGWRLQIHGGMGVLNTQNGLPQEIYSVYVAARRA